METNRYDTSPDDVAAYERTTIAATFTDRDRARDTIHQLHDEGFRDTWLGLIRTDDAGADTYAAGSAGGYGATAASEQDAEPRVEADNWFARVFGEGDESLHDALVRHGVSEADARSAGMRDLSGTAAIVTVDGANHPDYASEILTGGGGRLISGGIGGGPAMRSSGIGTSSARTSALYDSENDVGMGTGAPVMPSGDVGDLGRSNAGMVSDVDSAALIGRAGTDRSLGETRDAGTDEATRIRLREERLRIDKERLQRGEAVISKDVVSQSQQIDVPVMHEELFIERRPVTGERASADAGAIGTESSEIRIPLTEERVRVTKTPIITEEVVVGKREVGGTEHISETTLKEELNVRDVDATTSTSARTPTRSPL